MQEQNLKTGQLNFNLRVRDLSLCVGNKQLPKIYVDPQQKITHDKFLNSKEAGST